MTEIVLTGGAIALTIVVWIVSVVVAALLGVSFYTWYRGTHGAPMTPEDQWAETSEEAKQSEEQYAQSVMDRMNLQMAEEDEMLEREARPYRPTPRRSKYQKRFDYYIADEGEEG